MRDTTFSIQDAAGATSTIGEAIPRRPRSIQLELKSQAPHIQSDGKHNSKESTRHDASKTYWSHTLYRDQDDRDVKVHYSRTRKDSERLAMQFLKEPVLGFDMEWFCYAGNQSRLQEQVSLIQIACEDKIALFHIGLHVGKKTEDLIAPSLRKIIESPSIVKTGVAIKNADFSRLKKYFGLKPKSAFELSHLYRLITYGETQPGQVTTKLVALATQVEHYLKLPLWKGKERTSNWSKALNPQQIKYAADDAYACFMLYRCMDAKRMAMEPSPPLPLLADSYPGGGARAIRLEPIEKGGESISVKDFFEKLQEDSETLDEVENAPIASVTKDGQTFANTERQAQTDQMAARSESLDAFSAGLLKRLRQHRLEAASARGIPPYIIASNTVLQKLAQDRPKDSQELLKVKGIGTRKAKEYGDEWLDIIAQSVAEQGAHQDTQVQYGKTPQLTPQILRKSKRPGVHEPTHNQGMFTRTALRGEPVSAVPQLSTGLSFQISQVSITKEDSDDDDDSFTTMPEPTTFQLKRKRVPLRTPSPKIRAMTLAKRPELPLPVLQLLRNRLVAVSRRVTHPDPPHTIVSEDVINLIVITRPRTEEELVQIPGIMDFVTACTQANIPLLTKIIEWTATPALVVG